MDINRIQRAITCAERSQSDVVRYAWAMELTKQTGFSSLPCDFCKKSNLPVMPLYGSDGKGDLEIKEYTCAICFAAHEISEIPKN